MSAPSHFNLEAYFVAQALDHSYLMDDDVSPLMITENYVLPNTTEYPIPQDTLHPMSENVSAHAS